MEIGASGIGVEPALPEGPAALIIAHPGHELRVWGWMALAKPTVCVLTDGSGRSGQSRLSYSLETIAENGGRPGGVLGRFTDAGIYQMLLAGRFAVFRDLVDELAERLAADGVRCVAGDSCEGYNPSHDVCRFIIHACVEVLAGRGRGAPSSYDFPLAEHPAACPAELAAGCVDVRLDAGSFERKTAAAMRCPDLAIELGEAAQRFGADAFRAERLRPCPDPGPTDGLPDAVPFYESHGEGRVAAGKYAHVIRRREHMLPLAADLWRHARRWRL